MSRLGAAWHWTGGASLLQVRVWQHVGDGRQASLFAEAESSRSADTGELGTMARQLPLRKDQASDSQEAW